MKRALSFSPFRPRMLAFVAALAVGLATVPAAPEEPDAQAVSAPPTGGSAGRVPELDAAARALANDRTFKDASISLAVLDVDTGRLLAAINEHAPLNPASNAKLYTAAVALAMLHGDHRFETTLFGNVRSGAVTGALVLRGHGDPSLSTADLFDMVQEVRAAGVKEIKGDILVDQRFFDEQTTPPAFDQQPNEWAAFRAPISAVALNENTVTLAVRPTSLGAVAVSSFDPPGFVDVDGEVKTGESGADTVGLELSANGRRMAAKLTGAVAVDSRLVRYTRRVEDPTLLAGYALRALLEQAQIKVDGDVKMGSMRAATAIARHQSAPLGTLLYALGKQSDNFYAEMIFKSLGGETKGRPAKSADGAEIVTRWLDKIGANDTGVVIKNGSGLFDANRVTTFSVVELLRAAHRDPAIEPEYVAQLAVGGVDGTLRHRFRSEHLRRAVRAKTGTLDDAVALSGYVLGPPGKGPIAFSILMNHVEGKVATARASADTLVEMIVRRQYSSDAR
jgi:D-alanyl-D-alanine carboxypeptidase/D-alanyl-D-alanine-endopeptidase (penicillin-binding protein 4)